MPEQMIIWPDDEFDNLKGDKRLELLKKIDISQFIPQDVYNYYYPTIIREKMSIMTAR